jgi:hypothetical protein
MWIDEDTENSFGVIPARFRDDEQDQMFLSASLVAGKSFQVTAR